ncbi:DUF2200 domain-containing protein [Brevundimonas sp.]|jgi:hypothetical protein|uniref:DUF2200 domain-containing protein n=1 Tax=Brevundimonas sp. TaxID=1871086 RepID=UPI002D1FA281|nr:DUF2200 domain-containing protein [Brevundimonas sp.]
MQTTVDDRIRRMTVAGVYPFYVAKAERKGLTQAEVNEIIRWLTGYSDDQIKAHLAAQTTFEGFFDQAPALNPNRYLITGVICGHRVEEIDDPLMREIRHLDKLIDELARGKAMGKILRRPA